MKAKQKEKIKSRIGNENEKEKLGAKKAVREKHIYFILRKQQALKNMKIKQNKNAKNRNIHLKHDYTERKRDETH